MTLVVLLGLLIVWGCGDLGGVAPTDGRIELTPVRDNTLFESENGSLSNGAGPSMFAGMTSTGSLRRALVAFDLTSIPMDAQIDSVALVFHVIKMPPLSSSTTFSLHRVAQDWGEGTSRTDAGMGAAATSLDATWLHTFHANKFWNRPGGDFDSTASATRSVELTGAFNWGSTDELVADVKVWLADPASNFGWILIGENGAGSARVFGTREHPNAGERPRLTVYLTRPQAVAWFE